MKPKLIAIAGPLKGTIIELSEGAVSLGRDASNRLALADRSVSRRHCEITREGRRYKLRDLESHNGTFVNDVPTKEHALAHGDRLRVGNSYFLFLLRNEEESQHVSNEIEFDNEGPLSVSKIRYSLEDALYAAARDLKVLMKIGETINSHGSLQELERQLLEAIFEVAPAERGAILLAEDGDVENPSSVYAADKLHGPHATVQVSRTVARQVLKESASILSNNVVESEALRDSESLVAARTRSVLCVPLVLRGQAVGIIYLEIGERRAGFNEGHLQMVSAIAGFAAGSLESARRVEWLETLNRRLQDDAQVEHNMVGEGPRMREVYKRIARVAPADSTVLIRGESGTGKELAARAIHRNSPRAAKPFLAVNCAALTETLLESELFGHERGAFTGAVARKKGKLEIAEGGTLFLDEVGETSHAVQARLLRVLQEREFERVGGTHAIRADIRVVAATNRNLEDAIREGRFREDLYYRLNVVQLTMPPLRERREDIPLLASYFTVKHANKCKRHVTGISPAARACLVAYDWPGNVRELENAVERAVVLGSTERIEPEDLPESINENAGPEAHAATTYAEAAREAKRQIILKAVGQAGGNYTEAARLLGVHPNNLHRLMRNVGLREGAGTPKARGDV
jgi:transcriptional regulator with GAF, ATPase, and Fis domain